MINEEEKPENKNLYQSNTKNSSRIKMIKESSIEVTISIYKNHHFWLPLGFEMSLLKGKLIRRICKYCFIKGAL